MINYFEHLSGGKTARNTDIKSLARFKQNEKLTPPYNTSSIPKKFEVFHHKMADPVHTPGDDNKNHPMASITDHHMTGQLCLSCDVRDQNLSHVTSCQP